jgi:hypothetical protein
MYSLSNDKLMMMIQADIPLYPHTPQRAESSLYPAANQGLETACSLLLFHFLFSFFLFLISLSILLKK